jgi:hypothetical protein
MNYYLTCRQNKQNTKISPMIQAYSQTQTSYLLIITNLRNKNYCPPLTTKISQLTLYYRWSNHLIFSPLQLSILCKHCSIRSSRMKWSISLKISKWTISQALVKNNQMMFLCKMNNSRKCLMFSLPNLISLEMLNSMI